MSDSRSAVEQARQEKLVELRALGINPFAYRFERTHRAAEAIAEFESRARETDGSRVTVSVAGRIVSRRGHGKTAFLHLADASGRVQVYFKRDEMGDDAYALVKLLDLGDHIDEEATVLARKHAALALEHVAAGRRVAILSGGEARVVISRKDGRGGRNLVYLSSLAIALDGRPGVYALAADTDGIDGHGDHAGGMIVPSSKAIGAERGVLAEESLERDDSYTFFDACSLLIRTGATRTNVNDFRLILCHP